MTPRTDREIWWVGFKPDERLEAVWADFARDLEKENAELMKDKERLDWLGSQKDQPWLYWERPLRLTRETIDAFRKEAQP